MWTKLSVKNFKSIGEKGIDIELKPLTLLVGPNGSGKSSILQSICVFSSNVNQAPFVFSGELIQFSNFEDVAYRHDLTKWMTFEIRSSENDGIKLEYKHDSGEQKETVFLQNNDYTQMSLEGDRQKGWQLATSVPGQPPFIQSNTPGMTKLYGGMIPELRLNLNQSATTLRNESARILDKLGSSLKDKVFILSSLRGKVPSAVGSQQFPRWVGTEGEGLLQLLALISNTTLYEETWLDIQKWAARFGLPKLRAGIRGPNILGADYFDSDARSTINLAFAGEGSKQVMSIIVQLFWAQPDSLIMIEEPELSLHPEAQFSLGELFADAIQRDKQIIVTTHSHFFLMALNQAVEHGIKVEDIAVYHVTKDLEGTKTDPVKLSQRGYPLGWPPSYEKVEKNLARNWAKGLANK